MTQSNGLTIPYLNDTVPTSSEFFLALTNVWNRKNREDLAKLLTAQLDNGGSIRVQTARDLLRHSDVIVTNGFFGRFAGEIGRFLRIEKGKEPWYGVIAYWLSKAENKSFVWKLRPNFILALSEFEPTTALVPIWLVKQVQSANSIDPAVKKPEDADRQEEIKFRNRLEGAFTEDMEDIGIEGEPLQTLRNTLRRDRTIIDKFIDGCRARGFLACDECKMQPPPLELPGYDPRFLLDFHHRNPLALGTGRTSNEDLALLCPNCHRRVHVEMRLTARLTASVSA